jgi:hypothetical protein
MRAKEMRRGARDDEEGAEAERDAAKWSPSSESLRDARTPNDPPVNAHRRQQGENDDGQRKRAV